MAIEVRRDRRNRLVGQRALIGGGIERAIHDPAAHAPAYAHRRDRIPHCIGFEQRSPSMKVVVPLVSMATTANCAASACSSALCAS
jgi:hypothetical protein